MEHWDRSDVARVIESLAGPGDLTSAERDAAAEVVRALQASTLLLAEAVSRLEMRLAIRTGGEEAASAVRGAVVGAIEGLETVEGVADGAAAVKAVEELRASIARGERGREAAIAVTRFALRLVGRLAL